MDEWGPLVTAAPAGTPTYRRILMAAAAMWWAAAAFAQETKIIVHPANTAMQIQRAAAAQIFKGQMVRWQDGSLITPVDQSLRAPARRAFNKRVLGESVLSIQTYWQRQLQRGKVPPMVKGSDQEVADYVKANRGAIGYVLDSFPVDESVKVLKIIE